MPQRIFSLPEVIPLSGNKTKATLYRWIRAGTFPRPIRTGPNSVGWLESDLEKWQRERLAQSGRDEAS